MGLIASQHFKAIWNSPGKRQPTLDDFKVLKELDYQHEYLRGWITHEDCDAAIKATNLTKAIGDDMLDMSILKDNPFHHHVKYHFQCAMIEWAQDS